MYEMETLDRKEPRVEGTGDSRDEAQSFAFDPLVEERYELECGVEIVVWKIVQTTINLRWLLATVLT